MCSNSFAPQLRRVLDDQKLYLLHQQVPARYRGRFGSLALSECDQHPVLSSQSVPGAWHQPGAESESLHRELWGPPWAARSTPTASGARGSSFEPACRQKRPRGNTAPLLYPSPSSDRCGRSAPSWTLPTLPWRWFRSHRRRRTPPRRGAAAGAARGCPIPGTHRRQPPLGCWGSRAWRDNPWRLWERGCGERRSSPWSTAYWEAVFANRPLPFQAAGTVTAHGLHPPPQQREPHVTATRRQKHRNVTGLSPGPRTTGAIRGRRMKERRNGPASLRALRRAEPSPAPLTCCLHAPTTPLPRRCRPEVTPRPRANKDQSASRLRSAADRRKERGAPEVTHSSTSGKRRVRGGLAPPPLPGWPGPSRSSRSAAWWVRSGGTARHGFRGGSLPGEALPLSAPRRHLFLVVPLSAAAARLRSPQAPAPSPRLYGDSSPSGRCGAVPQRPAALRGRGSAQRALRGAERPLCVDPGPADERERNGRGAGGVWESPRGRRAAGFGRCCGQLLAGPLGICASRRVKARQPCDRITLWQNHLLPPEGRWLMAQRNLSIEMGRIPMVFICFSCTLLPWWAALPVVPSIICYFHSKAQQCPVLPAWLG